MARPDEESGDTRRRVDRDELTSDAWKVVQKLADERLLVTDPLSADRKPSK